MRRPGQGQARPTRRWAGLLTRALWPGVLVSLLLPSISAAVPDKKVVLPVLPTEEELLAMIEENSEKTIVIHIKTENGDKIKEKIKVEDGTRYSWTIENKVNDKRWIIYFNESDIYLAYVNDEAFLEQCGVAESAKARKVARR